MANKSRADIRRSVHSRIRKKVRGTSARPRLAVYRSTNHIYAQVIDDETGKTLAAASTVEKDFKGKPGGNISAAEVIGKMIADRAKTAGVAEVVFDRGGYVYHGRVKALIDASREAGLNRSANGAKAKPAEEEEKSAKKEAKTVKKEAKAEKAAPKKEAAPEAKSEEAAKSEEE
jgi:large subunit ribosomal protein L18